jgi:hypothetical protein
VLRLIAYWCVQYPWEATPRRSHSQQQHVGTFYIDKFPVTCTQFAAFIKDHSYTPRDATNFLKNWGGATVPAGFEKKPVTFVSLADARAYCSAYGKRLPHSWEWQVSKQCTRIIRFAVASTPPRSCSLFRFVVACTHVPVVVFVSALTHLAHSMQPAATSRTPTNYIRGGPRMTLLATLLSRAAMQSSPRRMWMHTHLRETQCSAWQTLLEMFGR